MTADGVDFDLDVELERGFNSQDEFGRGGGGGGEGDLYDHVIAKNVAGGEPGSESGETAEEDSSQLSVSASSNVSTKKAYGMTPLRKDQVYIGNLTWWTTDKDIDENLRDVGVQDFVEVNFYENEANGRSKGFCVVTVGSEASAKIIKEELPGKEIHGQRPVVTSPTKEALSMFEAQSKTRPKPESQESQANMSMMVPRGPMACPPLRAMGPQPGSYYPNQIPLMVPQSFPLSPQRPPPGMNMGFTLQPQQQLVFPRGQMLIDSRGPAPRDWNRLPMTSYPPPITSGQPGTGPIQGPPLQEGGPPPLMRVAPPPPHLNPAFFNLSGPPGLSPPHLNPAFFNPSGPAKLPPPHLNSAFFNPSGPPGLPPSLLDRAFFNPSGPPPQGRPSPHGFVSTSTNARARSAKNYSTPPEHQGTRALGNDEFEEALGRNRTVSNSAISRAVEDAAAGDIDGAVATLFTAATIIKQSNVGDDDRCRILIKSLYHKLLEILLID